MDEAARVHRGSWWRSRRFLSLTRWLSAGSRVVGKSRRDVAEIAMAGRHVRLAILRPTSFLGLAMSEPHPLVTLRIAYLASQLPRVAWYAGHEMVFRQLAADARRRSGKAAGSRVQARARRVHQNRIYADMLALLRQDLANVEAGIYPLPRDHDGSLLTRLYRSWLFFDDLPEVYHRRERNGFREALNETTRDLRPDYYLQNFHFQSGGWMTEDSAERYDTQVEVLFKGTANAMRRQTLPQLFEVFSGHDQRDLRLIDLGCGTGRFLDLVNQAWPRLSLLGLDLSETYIRHARRHLRRRSRLDLLVANAEAIPVPDNSAEAVTSIFMFHELPPLVRRVVLKECARVLKPGGRLIVLELTAERR